MKLIQLIFLSCMILFLHGNEDRPRSNIKQYISTKVFAANRMVYTPPSPQYSPDGCSVFIHSALGLPHPSNTTTYGRDVLDEMLKAIRLSGLMGRKLTQIYVTMLGREHVINDAMPMLRRHNHSHHNIHVMITSYNIFATELPTIHAVQLHAMQSHPRYGYVSVSVDITCLSRYHTPTHSSPPSSSPPRPTTSQVLISISSHLPPPPPCCCIYQITYSLHSHQGCPRPWLW